MAAPRKRYERAFRPDVTVLRGATEDRCEVYVNGEGITLIFERLNGNIRCIDRRREHDGVIRASQLAFITARSVAIDTMDGLDGKKKQRLAQMHHKVIVVDGSPTDCILSYLGWSYQFSIDRTDMPVWEHIRYTGTMENSTRTRAAPGAIQAPHLYGEELQLLKKRALGVIRQKREIEAKNFQDTLYRRQLEELQPKLL